MRKMTHPFFHDASILVSVGVFLTHRYETVGVFAHFLCVKNAKTPSIWSSVDIVRPDIVVVSEVFPKNMKPSDIDQNEYKLNGFSSFIGNVSDNSRGVVIYVRDGLNADYCSILTNSDFKESVWCEVRINKMEKLLIGGIYKSPNSDVANHMALNELITQAVELKYKHTIILGDFNFPEINWDSWSVNRSETHPSF